MVGSSSFRLRAWAVGQGEVVMRAIILVLLGGSLLWLVSKNIGSSQAGDQPGESHHSGYMLPPEAESSPSVPQLEAGEPAKTEVAAPATPTSPGPVTAADDSLERLPALAPISRTVAADAEAGLASELLHRPRSLKHYLELNGRGLSASHREIAMAFTVLLAGDTAGSRPALEKLSTEESLPTAELRFVQSLLVGGDGRSISTAVDRETVLLQAVTMGLMAKDADAALKSGRSREAAAFFSTLLLSEVDAPWPPERACLQEWTQSLTRAQASHRWKRDGDWPCVKVRVENGDSLISIRKRVLKEHPELSVCTGLIQKANELNQKVLQPGQVLRIPIERSHVLVDLSAHWVFYMIGEEVVAAWEVGVGRSGNETRPGSYTVGEKSIEPMWFPPGRDPIPYGDPENPLGTRWISWLNADGSTSRLGFHGTRDPDSVGKDLSQGCIRMRNPDVEELFEILPKESSIVVQP